ncbi:transcription factor [Rhodotorula toruloides]|uniref:Transcription factor n=1 Tax=Rhodotorula toruloides TaxID=5286 RepID=A0A511KLC5_RHOTO|nr:transcription factor [Rhodotorula toruloides]
MDADDSSLVSALGGALSPSPWSRFLSPSLFSQRSTPVPQVAPGPSPLKESTVVPPQPDGGCGLFTHAREINPFEKSFAVVDPEAVAGAVGRAAARMQGRPAGGDMALQLPLGRSKRKRALSSPAVFTPGGSRAGGLAGEAFIMKQAKRPDLRLVAKDSGIGMLDESSRAAAAPSTTYSLRSSSNSFDSTGSSLLRHRRGQSLTNSPETSAAPSPLSDKLGAGATAFVPVNSTFNHFQTQPVPFTMPAGQPPAAYPDPSLFAPTSLAPSSLGPDVVAPLPFDAQGPPFDSTQVQVNPAEAFGAHEQSNMQFLQPGLDVSYPPLAANFANPLAVSANPPHPHHLTSAPPAPIPHGQYLPPAHPSLAHQPIPLGAPIMPSAAPPPPFAAPVAKQTGRKKVSAASSSANGTHSVASGSPAAPGDSASPAPAPTKPPGKKRGRKPKNWDPTLERTVELDPEERERQRKLALERNRIAASKSRRRKKERVELLETASSDLCSRNLALQAECRALLTEVHSLRTFLSQNHPEGICTCTHINGYLARERDGGGIPAILYGAGSTLDRDYTRTPKWGDDDDLFAGAMESAALEAFSTGGGLAGVPGGGGSIATGRKKAVGKAGSSASPAASNGRDVHDTAAALDTLAAVVGPAQGSIPLKAPTTAGAGSPKKQASVATRRTSSRRAAAVHVSEDEDDSEGDDESSEEEAIELKSRRARAIAVRTKSG